MNNKRYTGYLIGGIVVIVLIYTFTTFNALVKTDEKVKLQWNEVQSVYQRRTDLIPNVVNIVKGQADFEQTTLVQVTTARAKAVSANAAAATLSANAYNEQLNVQNELASAANRLMITIEKYPQLRGTEAFEGLQVQLEGTERRIKVARKDFNEAIADYNSRVKAFPTRLVAGIFGFPPKEGFKSDAGAGQSVEIKFN